MVEGLVVSNEQSKVKYISCGERDRECVCVYVYVGHVSCVCLLTFIDQQPWTS